MELETKRVCPTWPDPRGGTLVGCGSVNVTEPDDEGLCDCLDCGIWFPADDLQPGAPDTSRSAYGRRVREGATDKDYESWAAWRRDGNGED